MTPDLPTRVREAFDAEFDARRSLAARPRMDAALAAVIALVQEDRTRDPSTPVPSDEAVAIGFEAYKQAAVSLNVVGREEDRHSRALHYAIEVVGRRVQAEARAATLRDMTGDEALNVATAAFENRIGTTHGVGDGMRAALAALADHFNPEANDGGG